MSKEFNTQKLCKNMRLKRSLILILFVLTLLPLVQGADDTFKQNQEADLKYFCQKDTGADCSASAVCNVTLLSPTNNTIIVNNKLMTNQIAYHNYTLNASQTTMLGVYTAKVVCLDAGLYGWGEFTVEVNPSGTITTTGQGLLYIALLSLFVIMFILSLWGTIKIPWKNYRDVEGQIVNVNDLKYLKLVLFFFSHLLLIFISWTAWNMGDYFLIFNVSHTFFKAFFYITLGLILPMFLILFISGIYAFFHDKKIRNLLLMRLPVR